MAIGKSHVKITVDLSEFTEFTRTMPGVFQKLVKESFGRGAAKIRKELIKSIDNRSWAPLQETPQYRSKYKPLQYLRALVRFKVTGGMKRVTATAGMFVGKTKGRTINGAKFKARFGITFQRFCKLTIYGGKLRIASESARRGLVKKGFFIHKGTKVVVFPRRDFYTVTTWTKPGVIVPYVEKDLTERVNKYIASKYGHLSL